MPRPGRAQTLLWDDKLKGFGLRVTENGTKAFFIEYRPKGSTQSKRHTLGRFGKLTADQARKLAKEHFSAILHGDDPSAKEKAAKAERTVNELLDSFVTGHVEKNNKPSTAAKEKHSLNCYVRPHLGKLKLSALTGPAVKRWHTGLKTPVAANRALAYLRRACKFGMEHGWLASNPCAGLTPNKETAKDRFLNEAEISRIGEALDAHEAKGALQASLAFGVRLLALTGLRKSEVRTLRWDDFDPIKKTLRLRDGKTGTRTVALFPEAVKLLRDATRRGVHIVPGANPANAVADSTFTHMLASIMADAKVQNASAHTFRHTAATFMAQNGVDAFAICHMGGWKTLSMVQRYVTMNAVGDKHPLAAGQRIAIALAGGNVVAFKATA